MRANFWKEFQRRTIAGLTTDELSRRAALGFSWQNWAFNSVLMFFAAGFFEEVLKYLPIAWARRRGTAKNRQQRSRAYIDYALAGALSFGVVENIGFIYSACEGGKESWPRLLLTLSERIILGSFGHLLLGASTALRATQRDFYGDEMRWWSIIAPSVLTHGTFNFVAISCSALEGNVGWIHPTGLKTTSAMFGILAGLVATAAWQVRRDWKALDERDQKQK